MQVHVLHTFACVSAASAASLAATNPSMKGAALCAAPLYGFEAPPPCMDSFMDGCVAVAMATAVAVAEAVAEADQSIHDQSIHDPSIRAGVPSGPKWSQGVPRGPKGSQVVPRGPKWSQGVPKKN